eukprot:scaffold56081_cov27-Tisochrysis_lutea.AAC.2
MCAAATSRRAASLRSTCARTRVLVVGIERALCPMRQRRRLVLDVPIDAIHAGKRIDGCSKGAQQGGSPLRAASKQPSRHLGDAGHAGPVEQGYALDVALSATAELTRTAAPA